MIVTKIQVGKLHSQAWALTHIGKNCEQSPAAGPQIHADPRPLSRRIQYNVHPSIYMIP
jgi:hypothetical protein